MPFWNRLEQRFKQRYIGLLERLLGRVPMSPDAVELATLQRILVIRQHDQLGDFLLATPVLRALREQLPNAYIAVVTREYFAELAAINPHIDDVLIFYKDSRKWRPASMRRFWRQLRQPWDLAIVLNTVSHSFTSDLLAHLSRARFVLGSADRPFPGSSRNFFYNLIAPLAPEAKHQSHRNLDIVRYLGIDTSDASECIAVPEPVRRQAEAALLRLGRNPEQPLLAIHPGAGKIPNRWPVAQFAALAQQLAAQQPLQFAVFGGRAEQELVDELITQSNLPLLRVPPCTLTELAGFFACCDLVVCNDTGVMHVAAATGTPLAAIFGPTDPAQWKPLGEHYIAVRGHDHTTASVAVEEVVRAVEKLMAGVIESQE